MPDSATPGWSSARLGEALVGIDAGWSPSCPERPPAEGEWGVLKVSAVTSGYFKANESKVLPPGLSARPELRVAEGDVLVARANGVASLVGVAAQVGGRVGRLMLSDKTLRLVPQAKVLDNDFLLRVLHSSAIRGQVLSLISGSSGQKNLSQAQIRSLRLRLPPLPEQRRIAEILDTTDEAIRKTEEIIAKLKQVKQGLLHDLLTRGIDDNGELRDPDRHPEQFKDSPLGRIPKAWEVAPLGSILDGIDAGKSPSCPDRPAQGDEWGVLKVSAVRPAGFQPLENKAITNSGFVNPAYEVHHGDLLISRANTYALVGLTCFVELPPPRLLLCDKTLRLRTSDAADRQFVFYSTQMPYVRAQIETHATGSSGSMKNIGQEAIRGLRLRLPGLGEQRRIAAALRAHDLRVRREQATVEKQRLVKQGLMEDLLTGRVRGTSLLDEVAP